MTGKQDNSCDKVRVKLDVPRIGFFDGTGIPEDDPFPQSVKAFLQHKKDTLGLCQLGDDPHEWHKLHCFAMGTSGAAVRNCWNGYSDLAYGFDTLASDPIVGYENTIEAVGYEGKVLLRRSYAEGCGRPQQEDWTADQFKKLVVNSINAGSPVIALGVVGPPEACLITGYDNNGDTAIGWSCFQSDPGFDRGLEQEPTGEYRKPNWFEGTYGLIVIGDKTPQSSATKADQNALKWALRVMKAKSSGKYNAGQDAYHAWEACVCDDGLYEKAGEDEMRKAHAGHWGNAGILAQARAWGGQWLEEMAERHPEARMDLADASGWFNDIHDLVWAMWEFMGGYPQKPEHAEALRSGYLRNRIACLIRIMAKCDSQAVRSIEKALLKIDSN